MSESETQELEHETSGPSVKERLAEAERERDEARAFVEALQLETALEWGIDGTRPRWRTEEEWSRKFNKYRGYDDEGNPV